MSLRCLPPWETWDELQTWMSWAGEEEQFTLEKLERRNRQAMANFVERKVIELIGLESGMGEPVVWCGFHDINWDTRECDTGYWVRKRAWQRFRGGQCLTRRAKDRPGLVCSQRYSGLPPLEVHWGSD